MRTRPPAASVGTPGRGRDWPLVGREPELERVAAVLRGGGAGGVVLAGPAGVGKSRVGHESLRLARDAGFTTAHAVATRTASRLPLGALASLLPVAEARREHEAVVREAVEALVPRPDRPPLALLVDDAHLLDDMSAAVLLQLAMSPRAFVAATVRTGEHAPDAVVALWREGVAERIEVATFDRATTDQLVASTLGGPVDGRTRHQLWEASRGNALVLRELVLGALEIALLTDETGIWRLTEPLAVPPPLVELVQARLAEVSRDELGALEILAVGEPLELTMLVALTSPDVIDSIERRGLVTVVASRDRREVRLVHPIHGEVLSAEMTALRAISVCRLLADAIEATGARRREDMLRLAIFRLDSGGRVRSDLMTQAARQAYFARDDALAERLARAALDADGGVEAALLLGEVLRDGGRHADGETLLADAAETAATDRQRALVAMARAEILYWGLGREAEARAVLVATEAAVTDAAWGQELAGVRATYELLGNRPRSALAAVEPLLANAEGRPLVEAATVAVPALAISGRADEALRLAERAVATRIGLGEQQVMADVGLQVATKVFALGEAGRLDEAMEVATAAYDVALDARLTSGVAWAALVLARIALLQGRLDTADRFSREGSAAFGDLGQAGPRRWCEGNRVLAAAYAGDASAAAAAMAAVDALSPSPMLMMETEMERARAWHAIVHGDAAGACRRLTAAADDARAGGALALEACALHDLARAGAPEAATRRLGELTELVDGELVAARAAHADALARGDGDALDACADAFADHGAMLFAAEAAAGAAGAHRQAHSARSAQRSARRATALTRRCESAGTPALALAGPTGALTRREREVTTLAVQGITSAVIAERLAIGVRTVESHLQHAYEKLGVRSRSDLAAALADADDIAAANDDDAA